MADGNLSQMRQGFIVVYLVTMEDAAVPVVRILAHADVGNDGKVRIPGLDGPHGLLNDPVFRPGGGAAGVLFRREAEEDAVLHAVGQTLLHGEAHAVQTVVVLAWQTLDGPDAGESFVHENGIDKCLRAQPGFPVQAADSVGPPQAARAVGQVHGEILLKS